MTFQKEMQLSKRTLIFIIISVFSLVSLSVHADANNSSNKQTIRFITLPELTEKGADELLNAIKDELASKGYHRQNFSHEQLSELPKSLHKYDTYTKKDGDKQKVIRFGVIKYLTRPSRMWLESVILENNKSTYNSDIVDIIQIINEEVIQDLDLKDQLLHEKIPSRIFSLPRLSNTQQFELLNLLKLQISLKGYMQNDSYTNPNLTNIPTTVNHHTTMLSSYDDKVRVIRFGIIQFSTFASQLWVEGLEFTNDNKILINSDLEQIALIISKELLPKLSSKIYNSDTLSKEIIDLSYASSDEVIKSLKAQGYSAYNADDTVPKEFSFQELPVIIEMPAPNKIQTGLVGEGASGTDSLTVASRMSTETVSSRLSKILVIYHPDHKEQLVKVKKNIKTIIDKPARQVLIEGMVLEISESGLEQLGVKWEIGNNDNMVSIKGGEIGVVLNRKLSDLSLSKDWNVTLQALIENGKAEVLSRPSVLTLDNRQATIRIGEDEPIAKTTTIDNTTSTSFEYLPTGILLNVRPQINSDGTEISMAIDTTVSQIGEMVTVTDSDAAIVAQAPRISTRRVQTYAKVTNNTPFIIGGLISRDKKQSESKTPYLSNLPFVGKLFNTNSDEYIKREVIIMLTPYVLPEEDAARTTPKDDDLFDSIGNKLFRSSYRMKKSDLTDLSFITENPRIKEFRNIAQKLADYGSPLAKEEPFCDFVNGRFPGEKIIVQNVIYNLVNRKEVQDDVELEKLKFFKNTKDYGFKETDLYTELKKIQREIPQEEYTWWEKLLIYLNIKTEDAIKDKYKDNGLALAMTYTVNHDSIDMRTIFREPIPTIKVIPCANRDEWQKKLKELNTQNLAGQSRYTILINNQEDIARLKAAIMMKETVLRNGGLDKLSLKSVEAGKQLLLPDFKKGQDHMIDAEVARYFVSSNFYYPNLIEAVESSLNALINSLQKLFLHTNYEEHGLTREQLSKIGLATPIDIYLKANKPTTTATYSIFDPVIDGVLNDAIWQTTDVITDFVETKTRAISKLTDAKVAYDDTNLYIAIRCNEPFMGKLKADAVKPGENVKKDDCVEISIDTNCDRKTFFQFVINANNTVVDYRVKEDADTKYDANIKSAVRRDNVGWSVEVAIPWTELDVSIPTSKTKMGLLLFRKRTTVMEEYQFPFLNGSNHRVEFYGDLIFK